MNVLLIQPEERDGNYAHPFGRVEPLGLETIGGALKSVCDVELLDLRFTPRDEVLRKVCGGEVEACGITTTFTVDYNRAVALAAEIKSNAPSVFVFAGGHHASLCPSDCGRPEFDAVVMGEGELTAIELIKSLEEHGDITAVAGLAVNLETKQLVTPSRQPARRLDNLPFPARELVRKYLKRYRLIGQQPISTLETSRGCPYRCSFCSVWVFYNGNFRTKSPSRVLAELESLPNDEVLIVDDNFFAAPGRAGTIAKLIGEKGISKSYMIQARTDSIVRHRELLDAWKEIGLRSVFLGFEKPDQAGLDGVSKENDIETNEKALGLLRERGIEPVVSFIVDTKSTHEELEELRRYVRKLGLRLPFFTVMTPLPGTGTYQNASDELAETNRDLFDLLHPVVPTRLPAEEFAREMSKLYRVGFPVKIAVVGAIVLLGEVIKGRLSLGDWKEMIHDWSLLTDESYYMDRATGGGD